ncbi:hypothetical protein [Thermococcus barophilus]|uniref:Uncharacterized protein n=1 Tax=Thermococcus barophilus (strain DSM 11836 / MP) TaxID=391623 RepID=F0LMV1_THEBM|nr:hypothetical protein [Thermococcus barophilus]ADT84080.1 hypothetical protein TERMP_01104 [Thermococcus barophilus MP]
MNWEKTLRDYERTNRRIGRIFILLGIVIAVFGIINVYLNFEYLCIQAFGTVYPNTSSALAFTAFLLPYLFTGTGLGLLGITIERKLNLKNAEVPLVVLILLPIMYSTTKFLLSSLMETYYSPISMIESVLISVFLIAGYLFTKKM